MNDFEAVAIPVYIGLVKLQLVKQDMETKHFLSAPIKREQLINQFLNV
jgi:hypothetical protein